MEQRGLDFLNLREIGWHKTLNSSSFVGCAPRTSLCSCSVELTIIKLSISSFVAHRKEFYTNRAFVASWSSLLQLISAPSTIAKVKEYHLWHKTTAPRNPPKSKTTATTTPPEETTLPLASPPTAGLREKPKARIRLQPPPAAHPPRFDETGEADQLPELLEKAKKWTLRRRNQNSRRRLERPRPVARMGGQTGGEILRRRSGGAPYPRAP